MLNKEKSLYILLLLFICTLYSSQISSINIMLMGMLVLYTFFYNSISEKIALLKERKHLIGMLFYFLVVVISLFISENKTKGLRSIELQLPLLLFPLSLGLITTSKRLREKVFLSFSYFTTAACFICLLTSCYTYSHTHRTDIFFNDNFTLALSQQSVYIAFLVNLSIYILTYHVFYQKRTSIKLQLAALLFLLGCSILLASRLNLLLLIATCTFFCFYSIFKKRKIKQGATLLVVLLLGLFAITKIFPQTSNRFKEITYSKYEFERRGTESHFNVEVTEDQWNGANFRLAAWSCGLEIFREHPLFGVGIGDKQAALRNKYKEKNFYFAIETNKNIHSNYIDILYSLGLMGFITFTSGWIILPIYSAYRNNDGLSILIFITFMVSWITEVYFARSLGAIITGFMFSFLLTNKKGLEE